MEGVSASVAEKMGGGKGDSSHRGQLNGARVRTRHRASGRPPDAGTRFRHTNEGAALPHSRAERIGSLRVRRLL